MEFIIEYALSFLGVPYKFGANSRLEGGIDCSGLSCELARASGLIGKEDMSAQMFHDFLWKQGSPDVWKPGSYAFYGKSASEITHVAFCLNDKLMIEAGGGRSTTKTIEEAAALNAQVRVRPIRYRGDLVVVIYPRYASIGMI